VLLARRSLLRRNKCGSAGDWESSSLSPIEAAAAAAAEADVDDEFALSDSGRRCDEHKKRFV
jgi:hypothetical protein